MIGWDALHVGATVWRFDANRRIYSARGPRGEAGRVIWREHWGEHRIVGETSRSWLVPAYGGHEKLPKAWPADEHKARKLSRNWCASALDLDMRCFANDVFPKIHERLRFGGDVDPGTLLVIADALGIPRDGWRVLE